MKKTYLIELHLPLSLGSVDEYSFQRTAMIYVQANSKAQAGRLAADLLKVISQASAIMLSNRAKEI